MELTLQTQAPAPPAPALAVVVCGYTPLRLDQLVAAAAEAHRQATAPGDEVVVVVDHHDDLLERVRALVPDGVRVVPSTGAQGLSGARNTGVAVTSAPLVVFVDDDALLRPGALGAVRRRAADPAVAAVAGAVHPAWEGGSAPRWFPEEFGWVVGCDYRGLPADGGEVRNPIGAAMAVRRDALALVGGFSSDLGRVGTLPAGCEETLVGILVRQELPGSRIVRDTGFAVDHHVPAARQTPTYLVRRCFHEGRSKAVITRVVGAGDGLSAERSYAARVLTRALLRAAADAVRGDRAAPARAGAVVLGLAATVVGLVTAPRPAAPSTGPSSTTPSAAATRSGARADEPELPADALVSVVVATLGIHPRLVETVEAALAQTHRAVEVVVVDNAPHLGRAAARLAGHHDERLRVVPCAVPGVSAARNTGLAASSGAVVAFTDDDAVPDPDWVEHLLDTFRRDRDGSVGSVTGRVLAATTASEAQGWFEDAGIFDKGPVTTTWSSTPRPADDPLGVPGRHSPFFPFTGGEMGSGNNMAFRRSVLAEVGAFDVALGPGLPSLGGEDLDLLRRVVLSGRTVVYRADAVVRHHHRETLEELRTQMHGYGVGMSSVLTKILLQGGPTAALVVRRVPRGLWHLLAPGSPKNVDRPAAMPRSLVTVELGGYLLGPLAYLRSRLVVARRERRTR